MKIKELIIDHQIRREAEEQFLSPDVTTLVLSATSRILRVIADALREAADYYTEVPILEDGYFGAKIGHYAAYGYITADNRVAALILETTAEKVIIKAWTGDAALLSEQWATWIPVAGRDIAARLLDWHCDESRTPRKEDRTDEHRS